ncbi:hypothetical protein N7499_007106 [Penicillium canescens]|uniref:Uncharacterized protein n=1 Tax=Penicillium canescens TaxID=5083 RepID=A0AAD6NA43_PENCN|nr:uncharacterized protein N7446_002797 [Penicillium canescens]KAJ6044604.1 hypothetical protein N7460_005959 [Penicillium canescens]KAJ6056074.1 hypothetical protein N7444_005172 [Penicillium canescens]KAJ6075020.1 hypothetical protein N7446_002797 [Penicillium canescens]KAJ6082232.1 hypothetical protein N7499_007106 [Penicillium canescens]KAJ6175972.1 hypothetical protein N7485_002886 [Penicillium canescens]
MTFSEPLKLEPNTLYILLLDRGNTYLFHWELYLAQTAITGTVFHIINEGGPTAWEYKSEPTSEISTLGRLVLALQIGTVSPVLHAALADRLAIVPLTLYSARYRETLNCVVWVLEALFALDDEGYMSLRIGIREIEQEAKQIGMMNKSQCIRTLVRSRAFAK